MMAALIVVTVLAILGVVGIILIPEDETILRGVCGIAAALPLAAAMGIWVGSRI